MTDDSKPTFNVGDKVTATGVVTDVYAYGYSAELTGSGATRGFHIADLTLVTPEPEKVDPADLQAGDRVRWVSAQGLTTVEGAISSRGAYLRLDGGLTLSFDAQGQWFRYPRPEPVEPEYVDGEIWVDAVGVPYRYLNGDHWQRFGFGIRDFAEPIRPLRRMVPEDSKTVQP